MGSFAASLETLAGLVEESVAAAPAAATLDFTDKGVLRDQLAHSLVEYTAGGFGVVSNRAIHSDKIVIFATGVPAGTGVSVDDFQSSIKAILPGVITIGGKQGPASNGAGIVHQGISYELFAVGANPGDHMSQLQVRMDGQGVEPAVPVRTALGRVGLALLPLAGSGVATATATVFRGGLLALGVAEATPCNTASFQGTDPAASMRTAMRTQLKIGDHLGALGAFWCGLASKGARADPVVVGLAEISRSGSMDNATLQAQADGALRVSVRAAARVVVAAAHAEVNAITPAVLTLAVRRIAAATAAGAPDTPLTVGAYSRAAIRELSGALPPSTLQAWAGAPPTSG